MTDTSKTPPTDPQRQRRELEEAVRGAGDEDGRECIALRVAVVGEDRRGAAV